MERTARMTKEPRSGNRGKNITVKYWRNQATQRRLGHVFPELARQANDAAKEYHDAVRRQKKVQQWDITEHGFQFPSGTGGYATAVASVFLSQVVISTPFRMDWHWHRGQAGFLLGRKARERLSQMEGRYLKHRSQ